MSKRLYKSDTNRVLSGVCGGVAEYFGVDPTIVRLIWALVCIPSAGTAIVVYIIAALVMPHAPHGYYHPPHPGHGPDFHNHDNNDDSNNQGNGNRPW